MSNSFPSAGVRSDSLNDDKYYSYERPEILSRIKEYPIRVLDVGCGNGALGSSIRKKYPKCNVIGIEFSENAVNNAVNKLDEVLILNLNELNPDDIKGEFDLIICADVIEHLLDPEYCLNVLRSKLTSNGKMILSIPNLRHWSVLLPLLVNDRFTYTDEGLLDRTHLHLFTFTEIKLMLSRCKFRVDNTDITMLNQKPSQIIIDKLLKSITSLGGKEEYAKTTINAYQYIIDASLIN